jgi:hypothetical protein
MKTGKPRIYCSGSLWWITEGPDKFHLFGPFQSFGKVTNRAARRRPVNTRWAARSKCYSCRLR